MWKMKEGSEAGGGNFWESMQTADSLLAGALPTHAVCHLLSHSVPPDPLRPLTHPLVPSGDLYQGKRIALGRSHQGLSNDRAFFFVSPFQNLPRHGR